VSQSNTSHTKPNSPQTSSQALLDELRTAADRARDERLKLARLVKHSADLPIGQPAAADAGTTPDARFVALSQQIERLEQTVGEKLQALNQVQQDIESRSQYLESLRHTITDTTRAFVTQVEQAQHFKAHVDAAKQHVKMSAGRVVEDIRQHLSEYEGPIAKRIEQLTEMDEQIDKRIARMQQMHKQAGEAVDKHLLAALRSAKEQAGDLAQPVKEEVDKHLLAQAKKIEDAIQAKIGELDVDVEEALNPLTQKFDAIVSDAQNKADLLADTMPDRLETIVAEQVEAMRVKLVSQAEELIKGLDERAIEQAGERIRERVAKSLDGYLAEADEHAGGYVDGLIAKLDEAREQALSSFHESMQKIEAESSINREQSVARLNEEVQRLTEFADERMAHAQSIVEGASDGIHRRATAAVESALRNADAKIDEYESNSVEQLRLIDQGIDHSIEQTRDRLREFEGQASKQGDEAMDLANSAIVKAQERLANFEAGITQRIATATQTVDDSVQSIDQRMHRVEQDASARVMQIVDLAEESGRSVAQSIAALSVSAQETAAKAQADLDEKLDAFESISAEALKTAEQTLRSNITELRDSSRMMIEVVTKQVKAQAAEIEPQAKEVISQAEQTMRRRLGELRDGAQGMVELTVSRLESQLNDVKARAQQAAFKGVEPKDAA
jgi:dimeric dUTPase (all-alpha-NTP-PPase superfamily)